jgi:hypothetical protein
VPPNMPCRWVREVMDTVPVDSMVFRRLSMTPCSGNY